MYLRQAWRYRWSQALALAGISLLIGASAAFAPWFTRAVEQTVATETLERQRLSATWQLITLPSRDPAAPARKAEELDRLVPAELRPLFTAPIHGHHAEVSWRLPSDPPDLKVIARLAWRENLCHHVSLTAGRCPAAAGEVIASTADQENFDLKPGSRLLSQAEDGQALSLTVVGIYRAKEPRADYWSGSPPVGFSRLAEFPNPGTSDRLLTDRSTFVNKLGRATVSTRPIPGVVRADDLQRLRAATTTVNGDAQIAGLDAEVSSALVGVIDTIEDDRRQARTIVPLVMIQVALFAIVVLALALAAVVDQRRPELAVGRLRGASERRIRRELVTELAVPVVLGTVAGVGLGFGLLQLVRTTWLKHGAPVELPLTVPAAMLIAVLAGLAVVWWTVRTVVRQPISALLRRVVPRYRSRALGMVDLSIIVVALAGLAAALTGGNEGPLAVLTPTLLALAVGLVFAHLLLPAAGLVSRRALRRGRLGLALGALQVSRRPAVTRIVAVVAVAGALVSFAGQAASVADHNRDTRAGYETGAEGVIELAVTDPQVFNRLVNTVDPDRQLLTPVVIARPKSPDALKSVMIEPDSFRRIAYRGDQLTDAEGFRALRAPTEPPPIEFSGSHLKATIQPIEVEQLPPAAGEAASPPARTLVLQANVVSLRNGSRQLVRFPAIPLGVRKPIDLSARIDCLGGCRLLRWGVARDLTDQSPVRATLAISKVGTDTGQSLRLGRPDDWRPLPQVDDGRSKIDAVAGPTGGLSLTATSIGSELALQYAAAPSVVPALITSEYPMVGAVTIPGIDGVPVPVAKLERLRGPVNRFPDRSAVVDVETLRRIGGTLDDGVTSYELWLNAAGLGRADELVEKFTKAGMPAELADLRSERIAGYGRSASALALQLTPVVGLIGWALAIVVLLLMVVTSWRSRAQDYASLRLTGVPAATTARAARWEQAGPAALAVLLGSACGVVGAQVALPMIPLFASTAVASTVPLELNVNWPVALILTAAGTTVLLTTTLLLGTGVNHRATFHRIREDLN